MSDLSDDARILVTGANGFVGSRVCRRLAADGPDVLALVRRADADLSHAGDVDRVVAGLDDAAGLTTAMDGVTHVVHCAAAAGVDHATAAATNVDGTRSVLEAAAAAGVHRVVHVSTTSVISHDAATVDEEAELVEDDAGAYAVTKRDAEAVVAEVARETGLATVVLRPPAVMGWHPNSTWGQRVPVWVRDGDLPFEPDRRASLGWVHVDDLADAVALALLHGDAPGRTYVVAAGSTTWGEYLGEVHSWFEDAPDPFVEADEPPSPRAWRSDRIGRELGWSPDRTLRDALAESVDRFAG